MIVNYTPVWKVSYDRTIVILAMASYGQLWLAMASYGQLWLAMATKAS